MTFLSVPRTLCHAIPMAFVLTLTINGPLHAQVVTFRGSGTVAEWRTYTGDSSAPGAPAILEAAFPPGEPFTATLTYDVRNVTLSFSEFPTSRYYRGAELVTSMSLQIGSSHNITPDPASVFGAAARQVLIINEPLADYLYGSADGLIDGSKTFAAYGVAFTNVGLTDFDATALPDINLPTALCLGQWEQLEFSMSLLEGEYPNSILYQLRGYGTPDRSIDSDADAVSDGTELASGSNPCNADTDADGLNAGVDPNPLVPGSGTEVLADTIRATATGVLGIPESSFAAPNANAQRGRKNALANQLQSAANAIEAGNLAEALSILEHVLARLDGDPAPPDVMENSPTKDALRQEVETLIALVRAELGR